LLQNRTSRIATDVMNLFATLIAQARNEAVKSVGIIVARKIVKLKLRILYSVLTSGQYKSVKVRELIVYLIEL